MRRFVSTGGVIVVMAAVTLAFAAAAHAETPPHRAFGWGSNATGGLGDGTSIGRRVPTTAALLPGNVVQVAAGLGFGAALLEDGTVWTWGDNSEGQLGDGTVTRRLVPQQVAGLPAMAEIDAGIGHVLARAVNGDVWAWGLNIDGQAGGPTTAPVKSPVRVANLAGVEQVAAGDRFSLALTSTGRVFGWGRNAEGQLGVGDFGSGFGVRPVLGLEGVGVVQISAGDFHSLAVSLIGQVYRWGLDGHLFNVKAVEDPAVPRIDFNDPKLDPVRMVAAGGKSNFALTFSGRLLAWGSNASGRLGDGTTIDRHPAVEIAMPRTIDRIVATAGSTAAIQQGGALWTWGDNSFGELGTGSSAPFVPTPTIADRIVSVNHVSMGYTSSLAVGAVRPVIDPPGDRFDFVGTTVSMQLTATVATPSYAWSAHGLPPGLSLDPATGRITGTPHQPGIFPAEVVIIDGLTLADNKRFSWTIRPDTAEFTASATASKPGPALSAAAQRATDRGLNAGYTRCEIKDSDVNQNDDGTWTATVTVRCSR